MAERWPSNTYLSRETQKTVQIDRMTILNDIGNYDDVNTLRASQH